MQIPLPPEAEGYRCEIKAFLAERVFGLPRDPAAA